MKPNRYSLRPFQRAILGFSNLWIHLSFKEFYWLSMPKIPCPPFQMGSWAMFLGGRIFLLQQRKLYVLFSVFFQTYFGIVYIWPTYNSFDQRIWFTIIFFLSRRATFRSKYEFSLLNSYILYPSSRYHRQNYQNTLQLFGWRIATRPFV